MTMGFGRTTIMGNGKTMTIGRGRTMTMGSVITINNRPRYYNDSGQW